MTAANRKSNRPNRWNVFVVTFLVVLACDFFVRLVTQTMVQLNSFQSLPYVNGSKYAILGLIGVIYLSSNQVQKKPISYWASTFFALMVLILAITIGFLNDNAFSYILGWSVYLGIALLFFYLSSRVDPESLKQQLGRLLDSNLLFFFIFIISVTSPFLGRGFAVSDFIFISYALARWHRSQSMRDVLLLAIAFGANHILLNGGQFFNVSRAFVIAVVAAALTYMVYTGQRIKIVIASISVAALLAFSLTLDRDQLQMLPRNIAEGIALLQGDRVENHLASYQRIFEAELVLEDLNSNGLLGQTFGLGLGRTLDMRKSSDNSVGNSALLGKDSVNNIHFLPFAILHKFGAIGLLALVGFLIWIVREYFRDIRRRRNSSIRLFAFLYIATLFTYAIPASNYLISDPIWPLMAGLLVATSQSRRGSGYRRVKPRNLATT